MQSSTHRILTTYAECPPLFQLLIHFLKAKFSRVSANNAP